MSGGSGNYRYRQVKEWAEELMSSRCEKRRALGQHLTLIATALYDIEWVDSGDYSPGDEIKSIMACISKEKVTSCLIEEAKEMIKKLEEWVKE